jgi:hypothetical protein
MRHPEMIVRRAAFKVPFDQGAMCVPLAGQRSHRKAPAISTHPLDRSRSLRATKVQFR